MRALALALVLCALAGSPAAARYRNRPHSGQTHARVYSEGLQGRPQAGLAAISPTPLARAALRYEGARRDPSGFRGEWCGDFLGFVARKSGYRVPIGYRLARRWALAGPRIRPQPGAVMVMPHHVGVVLRVLGAAVELISGNHGHKVAVGLYPIRRALAYVRLVKS